MQQFKFLIIFIFILSVQNIFCRPIYSLGDRVLNINVIAAVSYDYEYDIMEKQTDYPFSIGITPSLYAKKYLKYQNLNISSNIENISVYKIIGSEDYIVLIKHFEGIRTFPYLNTLGTISEYTTFDSYYASIIPSSLIDSILNNISMLSTLKYYQIDNILKDEDKLIYRCYNPVSYMSEYYLINKDNKILLYRTYFNKNSRKFKKAYNVMLQIIDKYYFEIDRY
jgi:hypothetical protein